MTAKCISFWYRRATAGEAIVEVVIETKSGQSYVAMTFTGTHGDSWYKRQVQLDGSEGQYRVIFKAYGSKFGNKASIDDVQVHKGQCPILGRLYSSVVEWHFTI